MIPLSGSNRIRVLLADDSDLFRRSVRWMLEDDSETQIVGETAASEDIQELLIATKPDVLFVDLHMLDDDVMYKLKRLHSTVTVIVMSALVGSESIEFARKIGVQEVLEKCNFGDTLIQDIKAEFHKHLRRVENSSAA